MRCSGGNRIQSAATIPTSITYDRTPSTASWLCTAKSCSLTRTSPTCIAWTTGVRASLRACWRRRCSCKPTRVSPRRKPRRGGVLFPKEDFRIDLEAMSCICPAGHKTRKVVSISSADRYGAPGVPLRAFRFEAAICEVCPLRPSCMRARPGKGRVVMIHPQEALLQEARAFQQSEAFAPYRKLPQAAEHRLARLIQLGVRQARYFGGRKTLFQVLMAATVANLTLVATKTASCEIVTTLRRSSLYISRHCLWFAMCSQLCLATLGAWVFGHASREYAL